MLYFAHKVKYGVGSKVKISASNSVSKSEKCFASLSAVLHLIQLSPCQGIPVESHYHLFFPKSSACSHLTPTLSALTA